MSKELYISATPHETRVAIVEDEQLAEIYYERENEYTLAGSIYKGKVTRVLPGMQSAFVDIGLDRDAFLYVSDFLEEQEDSEEYERVPTQRREGERVERSERQTQERQGQERQSQDRQGQDRQDRGERPERQERQERHDRQDRQDRHQRQGRDEGRRRPDRLQEPAPIEAAPAERFTKSDLDAYPPQRGGQAESHDDEGDEGGTRRWRGRRGRRGRGGRGGEPVESRPERPGRPEEPREPVHRIQAAYDHAPEDRAPLVLPGESLSKYRTGGEPEPTAEATASRPVAPRPTVQPSTLVDVNAAAWDGGLQLPGESISRYGRRREGTPAEGRDAEAAVNEAGEPSTEPQSERVHPLVDDEASFGTLAPPAEEPTPEASGGQEEPQSAASLEGSGEGFGNETPRESASHRVSLDDTMPFRKRSSKASAEPAPQPEASAVEEPVATDEHARDQAAVASGAGDDEEPATALLNPEGVPVAADAPEPAIQAAPFVDEVADRFHEFAGADEEGAAPGHGMDAAETGTEEETEEGPIAGHGPEAEDPTLFAPGHGHLEEEVIDEEESDPLLLGEADGPHEYEELEEQTFEQALEGDLSDIIREAHMETRTGTGTAEAPAADSLLDAEETDDEEFGEAEDEDEEEAAYAEHAEVGAPGGLVETDQETERDSGRRGGRRGRGRRQRGGGQQPQGNGQRRPQSQSHGHPQITDLLKEGQEILVQIAKEPIAKKGARITSHIALPGRFLVYMPTVSHVGVSRKIGSEEERQRLKRILLSEKGEAHGGFIVRTAAEGASEEDLRADIRFLINLWTEIKQRSDKAKAPALIYHDLNLVERILRDLVTTQFSTIWVDNEAEYERVLRFLQRFQPSLVRRVKLYTKETPLFEQFGVQEEINKALKSKVWLKSGGYIVINQTEALVAIDINTGKYVGKTSRLEDTIVRTNIDAIQEIVRQIRLRDLGGIIVIDFIDMDERKNRQKVMQALEEALKQDRAPSKVLQFNDFGLVAITRKRVRQSLERTLQHQCGVCGGTGMVKSPVTVCNEIYTELRKMARHLDRHDVMLRVHPDVVKHLKGGNAKWLNDMEEMIGRTLIVKSDPALHPEQFDIH